ncbi:hypothetical protein COLO4_07971 [Corchorus olitorius]|uniref:Uncharacterized protein n=1 Tax=Corchorus olitorius TaxID=93759 RepID=A0A1R3KHX0_9ROSI|nr:hypothetical protein COLO4_07971 [Corchorus olitorius]
MAVSPPGNKANSTGGPQHIPERGRALQSTLNGRTTTNPRKGTCAPIKLYNEGLPSSPPVTAKEVARLNAPEVDRDKSHKRNSEKKSCDAPHVAEL